MTIAEFCDTRFIPHHAAGPATRENYGYIVKNHVKPYIGVVAVRDRLTGPVPAPPVVPGRHVCS
jgi:hypothetical protein